MSSRVEEPCKSPKAGLDDTLALAQTSLRVLADEQVNWSGAVVGDGVGLGVHKADIEQERLDNEREEAAHLDRGWAEAGYSCFHQS